MESQLSRIGAMPSKTTLKKFEMTIEVGGSPQDYLWKVVEKSVHFSDGFPKKVWIGGWVGELYPVFICWNFFTEKAITTLEEQLKRWTEEAALSVSETYAQCHQHNLIILPSSHLSHFI